MTGRGLGPGAIFPVIEIRKRTSGYCRVRIPAAALRSIASKFVLSVNLGGKGTRGILRDKALAKEKRREFCHLSILI
jgi:hypothetical protein